MRIVLREPGAEYHSPSDRQIMKPQDAGQAGREIADSDTECMCVLSLDVKNGLRGADIITTGLLDGSLVHPREVFRAAIQRNAAAVIMVHNHPSGDTTPSSEDLRITKQMTEAGKIIDIKVLDHIILGANGGAPCSLRELGLCDF